MNKQLTFSYKNKDYTLEYTRDTVRQMQRNGFSLDEADAKPMVMLPDLFAGAFLKHHSAMKRGKVDEIYFHMPRKRELLSKLVEMYTDTLDSLLEDPAEGNIEWTPNWSSDAEEED